MKKYGPLSITDEEIENVSRAMCAADGIDPDLDSIVSMNPVRTVPAWTKHKLRAVAAIKTIRGR
jgi:hypothetical protein